MEFSCTARQADGHLAVTVSGDIDLAAYPVFEAEAQTWIDGLTDVVVDCSGVTFMDSMGISVLVHLMRGVTEAGYDFALAAPSVPVTGVLQLAGVQGLFKHIDAVSSPDADSTG